MSSFFQFSLQTLAFVLYQHGWSRSHHLGPFSIHSYLSPQPPRDLDAPTCPDPWRWLPATATTHLEAHSPAPLHPTRRPSPDLAVLTNSHSYQDAEVSWCYTIQLFHNATFSLPRWKGMIIYFMGQSFAPFRRHITYLMLTLTGPIGFNLHMPWPRGVGKYDPSRRFATNCARASQKNELVGHHETRRLVSKFKLSGQPVSLSSGWPEI